ncbi:MAG: NusG domain II-containing protein [Clostridia bacterium]|nr:NusG domain II-containing protein [Clostridia bacterium]
MENKKKAKNDIIFIVAVVLLIGLAAGAMLLFRQEGGAVEVKVNGKLYGTYSLSKDQVIEIRSGDDYNILVIENGKAYVREANCPGADTYYHKCTNKKPISYKGESILCKEHGVVIAIVGGEDSGGPDITV